MPLHGLSRPAAVPGRAQRGTESERDESRRDTRDSSASQSSLVTWLGPGCGPGPAALAARCRRCRAKYRAKSEVPLCLLSALLRTIPSPSQSEVRRRRDPVLARKRSTNGRQRVYFGRILALLAGGSSTDHGRPPLARTEHGLQVRAIQLFSAAHALYRKRNQWSNAVTSQPGKQRPPRPGDVAG